METPLVVFCTLYDLFLLLCVFASLREALLREAPLRVTYGARAKGASGLPASRTEKDAHTGL